MLIVLFIYLVTGDDEETNEESKEGGPLNKCKEDILYFLKLAGVANWWSYQLKRISGSESEDAQERARKTEIFFTKKRVRQEDMECRMHVKRSRHWTTTVPLKERRGSNPKHLISIMSLPGEPGRWHKAKKKSIYGKL